VGKYDGILICSDIDGTLTYESGKISKENLQAIRHFQRNGGRLTVCTGRPPLDFLLDFTKILQPNAPMITHNGTTVFDRATGLYLMKRYIGVDLVPMIEDIIPKFPNSAISFMTPETVTASILASAPDSCVRVKQVYNELKDQVLEIRFIQAEASDSDLIRNYINQKYAAVGVTAVQAWNCGIEVTNSQASKGNTALWLKQELGAEYLIGIGDHGNDLSLVECADLGCAVENAIEPLKSVADRILPKNTEHAIAALIESL